MMTTPSRPPSALDTRFVACFGVVALVFGLWPMTCAPVRADEPVPSFVPPPTLAEQWVREPYRVTLDLSFTRGDGPLTRVEEHRLRDRVEESLRLTFGSLWDLTSPESQQEIHKRLTVELRILGERWTIRAREWDVATASWTEWATDHTSDRERVGWCAAGLARRCFRPLFLIDTFRGELRSLAVRGETHWPEALAPPESHTLEIWLLYLNKEKQIEKRQRAPWSYLVHERLPEESEPDEGVPEKEAAKTGEKSEETSEKSPEETPVSAETPAPRWRAVTGVRGSLGTRGQRVLAVGLAVTIPVPNTELTLRPWRSTVRRIPGVDIVVTDRPDVRTEGEPAPPLKLVSDRLGRVVIPAREGPLEIRQLEVWSGKQVLARLPILPGARPHDVLELPDDELRLRIEGDMAILQASIIDVVSRRAVLMARIRRDARVGNWPGVDTELKSLDELPRIQTFSAEVARIEGPALEEAKRDRDRPTQARIKRLCADTRDMLGRFLSEEPVKLLREEIADLRAAAREQAAQVKAAVKAVAEPEPPPVEAAPKPAKPIGL